MTESEPLPSYNDAKEIERRAKMVSQSTLSVDKPGRNQSKGMRFRVMRTKPKARARKRWNPKRPDFL